jgi:HAD superfamily hydrolase (TIGR01484 family)
VFLLALAADFDGTLAHHGAVEPGTLQALEQLKSTGRRLVLVTGREVSDLRRVFPELHLFDRVVAENGGVILDPATGREDAIAPAPPAALVQKLMERQVEPISVGRTIVATWHPHETAVLSAIEELGLELHIIFNKGAVMILPAGVTKATGLKVALEELDLSALNVVAVGDAENDHAFLKACGCSAAVANALPSVKEACDIVLSSDHGAGVAELISRIMDEDVHLLSCSRSGVLLGTDRNDEEIWLEPGQSMIIAGGSGSGKSNFAILLTERMSQRGFELCVVDPEGDYADLDDAVTIGDDRVVASVGEAARLLRRPGVSVVVGTLPIDLPERQQYFRRLLPPLLDLKAATGRPHWLIVDEAHHFVPRHGGPALDGLAPRLPGTVFISPDPKWLAVDVLRQADALLAFGGAASGIVLAFVKEAGLAQPSIPRRGPDEALYWARSLPGRCRALKVQAARQSHNRHKGKYAAGDVGEAHSFYFRRKSGECVGRARNLAEFVALVSRVPDDVWERHLRAGDFAAWFLDVIRDEELARTAVEAASRSGGPLEGRRQITDAIEGRYRSRPVRVPR